MGRACAANSGMGAEMSLILEALRKSEAERRRGAAPDLRTELPPVASAPRAPVPRWAWAWIGTALAMLVLAATWLHAVRPGDVDVVAPAGTSPAPTPKAATPAPPPFEHATARIPADAGIATDPGALVRGPGTAGARDRTALPVSAEPDPIPGEASPAGSTPAQAAAVPPQPPGPRRDAAPMIDPGGAGSAPALTLAELPTADRSRLPPLKLSMHLWSEDPAQRFVILDGQRMAEGDRAGDIVLESIGRDDVVVAWNGTRLRLSLR